MEFDSSCIIDSNGQKYRAGWDEHGWFTMQIGELVEGEFHSYEDQYDINIPPGKIDELKAIIDER